MSHTVKPGSVLPTVEIVGLGPAGPELITPQTLERIRSVEHRFVRTRRHRAAVVVKGAVSCDDLYENAQCIEDVYPGIVERLVAAARRHGRVLYAVGGSPHVGERSVQLLEADSRIHAVVHPAVSFAELAWSRLGVDPLSEGVRLVDARSFAEQTAGESGPFLVAQCDSSIWLASVSEALLANPCEVWVLHHLGLESERIERVPSAELPRWRQADHLTSVFVPKLTAPLCSDLLRFEELVRTLREECPWDREQTHRSLRRHLIEEAYEVLEAIDALPPDAGSHTATARTPASVEASSGYEALEEELGDLLFHVFFHARMAAEAGQFGIGDVVRTVDEKLRRRHPHVFGEVVAASADAVRANWERIKKDEKGRSSAMDGIPENLPALLFALKVQKRAEAFGEELPGSDAAKSRGFSAVRGVERTLLLWRKSQKSGREGESAARELEAQADRLKSLLEVPATKRGERWLGEILFAVVDLARGNSLDPESALRTETRRVKSGFIATERRVEGS